MCAGHKENAVLTLTLKQIHLHIYYQQTLTSDRTGISC